MPVYQFAVRWNEDRASDMRYTHLADDHGPSFDRHGPLRRSHSTDDSRRHHEVRPLPARRPQGVPGLCVARPKRGADDHAKTMYFLKN
jgi:hypothetical protein